MSIPVELKYSKEHEWLRVEGDTATIGITAFAQGEFNEVLKSKPELVNSKPYEDGWMIKIKITNPEEIADLLDAAAYQALIG